MDIKLFQVDAFTDQPFRGNPAAVCILPEPLEAHDAAWMQSVASEMNLSETAFLQQVEDGFNLRWFTPTVEVDLCGHATLASAHILYEIGQLKPDQEARFQTKSGLLTAIKQGNEIELNFPATPPNPTRDIPDLADALGIQPIYLGQSRFDYLVQVGSEAEVRGARPDFLALKKLGVRGVMLTSKSEVDEDPVTGSAHCCLAPFWSGILGKKEMVAFQASARGGVIRIRVGPERVYLGGQALTVMKGKLLV